MKLRTPITTCFLFVSVCIYSQSVSPVGGQFLQIEPPATQSQIFNDVKKYGYNTDGSLRVDVNGSPFWNDEWRQGELFDRHDSSYGFYPVKINFAEGVVHFKNRKGAEMVIDEGAVKKIILYDSINEKKITGIFRYQVEDLEALLNKKNVLVQELNQGKLKLLKITNRKIESKDSAFGTIKAYFYKDGYEYFIERDNKVAHLNKLNKDDFLALVPSSSKYSAWIKEQKMKFKKEEDIVEFLDYYNSQETTK